MGVKGRLKDMGLVDIIQIFVAERRTVALHLGSELGYGRVYLSSGEVVHAEYREFVGMEALYHLLSWGDGEFEVEPGAVSKERTINESAESLLLECMRRMDESRDASVKSERYVGDTESIGLINKLLDLGILERK